MASTAGPAPDPIYVFYGFDGGVSAASFVNIKGKYYLLTGDSAGQSAMWDLATRKRSWTHQERKGLTQPSILACGSWSRGIWTHARGSCVRFWATNEQKNEPAELCTVSCTHIGFCPASLLTQEQDPEIDFVSVPAENDEHHGIEIYRLAQGEPVLFATIDLLSESDSQPTGSPMTCILTQPTTTASSVVPLLLVVGFESGTVRVWNLDPTSPRVVAGGRIFQETILGMDFSPSRRFGFCVSPEKAVSCWRLVDDETDACSFRIEKLGDISLPKAGASTVRIRDDGKIVAVGGWDGKIRVFALKTLKPLAVLQFHSDTIRCLCFCEEKIGGRRLMAAGSKDGSVSLWSLYSD